MTKLSNGILTDLGDTATNEFLTGRGYTIRHVETCHHLDQTCTTWDAPDLAEADLPY